MTKREMFVEIRKAVSDNAEMVAFIDKELDLLAKKSASRKPTKVQTENELLKADILATADEPLSIKAIQEATASLADLSNQRISHLLKALVDSEQVDKVYVKKVPLFSLASAVVSAD